MDYINIVPFIDMNRRDYSCLFSVICFVNNEIRSKELHGTSLTFDQSLLVKAVEIVRAKDVSHPDECSRWLIQSYRGVGRRRKRYDKLTVQMLSCICCRERLYLERFVLYIYWTRHKLMELILPLGLVYNTHWHRVWWPVLRYNYSLNWSGTTALGRER